MNSLLPTPGSTHNMRPLESIASKKRSPFMTLVVAAKASNAVVIAADRQISYDHSSLRTDIEKIACVEFGNFPAIVALADNLTNSQRYIAILRDIAKHQKPQSAGEAGLVIQRAMEQLRREVKNTYRDEAEDFDQFIREKALSCSMTVGFCVDNKPHIVTTNLLRPTYHLSNAHYETEGCGATLANFILAEYFTPSSDFERVALIAVYAVWMVIKYDCYCKGPITVWITCPPGGAYKNLRPRAIQFSESRVDDLVSIVRQMDAATKETRHRLIDNQLEERRQQLMRAINNILNTMTPPTEEELKEIAEEMEHDARNPPPA